MRKIDLHLARTFLAPCAVITAGALGLYVVADMLGQLDPFFRSSETVPELLRRMALAYLSRLPVYLTPLAPITVLISAAFAVSHLARNNEITALKACGIGIHRILAPVYVSASCLMLLAFANQELLVPLVEQRFLPRVKEWTESGGKRWHPLRGFVDEENTTYILDYDPVSRAIARVRLVRREGDAATVIEAAGGVRTAEGWRLEGPEGVRIAPTAAGARTEPQYLWRTALRPADLDLEVVPPASRPLRVIVGYLRGGLKTPAERRRLAVLLSNRLSYPLVGIALLLVGLPPLLGQEAARKSRLFGMGLCILIGAAYHLARFFANDLGEAGRLPPALAGLLPVLLFGAIGVYLTDRMRT